MAKQLRWSSSARELAHQIKDLGQEPEAKPQLEEGPMTIPMQGLGDRQDSGTPRYLVIRDALVDFEGLSL